MTKMLESQENPPGWQWFWWMKATARRYAAWMA